MIIQKVVKTSRRQEQTWKIQILMATILGKDSLGYKQSPGNVFETLMNRWNPFEPPITFIVYS